LVFIDYAISISFFEMFYSDKGSSWSWSYGSWINN